MLPKIITRTFFFLLVIFLFACSSGDDGPGFTAPGVVYVSNAGSNDADGLSPGSAKLTVGAAMELAGNGTEIRVADGNYSLTTALSLKRGVKLFGGYSADFTIRDIDAYTSTLLRENGLNVNIAIEVDDAGISSDTVIDGFTVVAGDGLAQSIIIEILAGSPTIENNILFAGTVRDRYGIRVHGGSPIISRNEILDARIGLEISQNAVSPVVSNNRIVADVHDVTFGISVGTLTTTGSNVVIDGNFVYGGDAQGNFSEAVGIHTSTINAITIRNNTIDAGSTSDINNGSTNGIRIFGGNPHIYNNEIYGGDGGGFSTGIDVVTAADIHNNTIDGGSAGLATSIYVEQLNPASNILNNIFLASLGTENYCVYEEQAAPLQIRNNNFSVCAQGEFYDNDAQCINNLDGDNNDATCLVSEMEQLIDIDTASGNVELLSEFQDSDGLDNDPTTLEGNDFRLSITSPDEVIEGGLNLSTLFTDDRDGFDRTSTINNNPTNLDATGWSMGAFEYE